MSGSRIPGPNGIRPDSRSIEDGTLIRAASPIPGVLGLHSQPQINPLVGYSFDKVSMPRSRATGRYPALQLGQRGPDVEQLQRLLNARLQPSPALALNGVFDGSVQQALSQYQKSLRINGNGVVDQATWFRLLIGDVASVGPTGAAPATSSQPVSEWTLEQKFAAVLLRTVPKLPASMRQEFAALLSPTNLAIMVGTLVVWAGAHAFGIGEAIDLVLLIGGVIFLGFAVVDVAQHLCDFLGLTCTARSQQDLDAAAAHLAQAIAVIGVAAFAALLAKGAKRIGKAKAPPPEQKPLMKEPGPKVVKETPPPETTPTARPVTKGSVYGGVTVKNVRPGTKDKYAVIGRSMKKAVEPCADGLRNEGKNVEIFSGDKISNAAKLEFDQLIERYKPGQVPDEVMKNSQMYKENLAWAQKVKNEGYTVVDAGNPAAQSQSIFYEMEQQVLF